MDVLADILTVTRVSGHVACHSWCDPPWGLRFEAAPKVWFHFVSTGSATLLLPKTKPIVLGPMDVVLLPHGSGHVMCDDPKSATVDIDTWRARAPRKPGTKPRTELLCGSYTMMLQEIHPVLRLLPPVIHVSGAALRTHHTLRAALEMLVGELAEADVGSERVISRLLEILFVLALRQWLDDSPDSPGWLGALRDPAIGRALVELHMDYARDWTIAALAKAVGMSRPVLARKFSAKVGDTPLGYLRKLRMGIATMLLVETDQSLAQIAKQVGYTSEFAFNRAFQRSQGVPPGRYRRARA